MGAEESESLTEELAFSQDRRLRQFLRARVANAADVPDLIQEVLLKMLRAPARETIRCPEAYIFTIARHAAQQHRLGSARTASLVDAHAQLCDLVSVQHADPVLQITAEQCEEAVEEALQQMAPKMRATFLLARRDGLSMEQISRHLGVSRPMAKKYMVKALTQLRKRLKEME